MIKCPLFLFPPINCDILIFPPSRARLYLIILGLGGMYQARDIATQDKGVAKIINYGLNLAKKKKVWFKRTQETNGKQKIKGEKWTISVHPSVSPS